MQFLSSKSGTSAAALAVIIVCGLATSAQAVVSASDPFVRVRATSGSLSGTFTVPLGDAFPFSDPDQDLWFWSSGSPVPIFDGPNLVGTLMNMSVLIGRNGTSSPERFGIDFDFGVLAGAGDTTFELISPTLSFGPIQNATGLVSAGLVGTDQNTNGITIAPAGSNGFGFDALFNGSSVFRSYFSSPLSNSPSLSVGAAGNMSPEGVYQPMGTISNMTSMYTFTVSAGDTAGGTTTYSVIPAPTTLAIIGLSGLVLGRRRR